ncbi:hypothetical protein HCN44_010408 [Aphidius gifuensis]|uniref:Uncharacterized protein n=1 Tax=Aphidius gifuensis TaxID=684658 RepID=A0A834Y4K7_APHGI|nr:hypothetical protein HCN44_010408 [Aphidius gifuensis]
MVKFRNNNNITKLNTDIDKSDEITTDIDKSDKITTDIDKSGELETDIERSVTKPLKRKLNNEINLNQIENNVNNNNNLSRRRSGRIKDLPNKKI